MHSHTVKSLFSRFLCDLGLFIRQRWAELSRAASTASGSVGRSSCQVMQSTSRCQFDSQPVLEIMNASGLWFRLLSPESSIPRSLSNHIYICKPILLKPYTVSNEYHTHTHFVDTPPTLKTSRVSHQHLQTPSSPAHHTHARVSRWPPPTLKTSSPHSHPEP